MGMASIDVLKGRAGGVGLGRGRLEWDLKKVGKEGNRSTLIL